jgi:hypothetical protein
MEEPTALEKLTGNLITQGGLAVIAASVGTPIAALLPILVDTLAAGRHRDRVKKTLDDIELILKSHRRMLDRLTDPQYKLLNETVLAVLQNTEDDKIVYLRRVIVTGIEHSEISHTVAAQVSRALRDMTAGELGFVVKHFGHVIMIGPISGNVDSDIIIIERNSDEMLYVSGLLGLGILIPAGSTIGDGGRYIFAKFCETLKALIEKDV